MISEGIRCQITANLGAIIHESRRATRGGSCSAQAGSKSPRQGLGQPDVAWDPDARPKNGTNQGRTTTGRGPLGVGHVMSRRVFQRSESVVPHRPPPRRLCWTNSQSKSGPRQVTDSPADQEKATPRSTVTTPTAASSDSRAVLPPRRSIPRPGPPTTNSWPR